MLLEVSSRVVAQLVSRLAKAKLTPVAQAAKKHEKQVASVFIRSVKVARDAVPMHELERVLSLGHSGTGAPLYVLEDTLTLWGRELLGDGVEAAPVDWIRERVRIAATVQMDIPSALYRALLAGAKAAGAQTDFDMAFDIANPEAITWAERHSAKLVTSITTEARHAIRAVVVESFQLGIAPRETAKLIRALGIGLTERDAVAVMRRQLKDLASGMNSAKAAARAEKYAAKLLRSRSITIARTETMRAANEGQRQLWQQAIDKGLMSPNMQKVWITADPCPICAPLDGETVGVNEDFSIGADPPAHPRCKCTIGLVN